VADRNCQTKAQCLPWRNKNLLPKTLWNVMTDAFILMLALGGMVAVLIYASILAWLFIQEFKDD
jgi:hypothetical protein